MICSPLIGEPTNAEKAEKKVQKNMLKRLLAVWRTPFWKIQNHFYSVGLFEPQTLLHFSQHTNVHTMSSAKRCSCESCGNKGFRSKASLHQHQSQNKACFAKLASDLGSQCCSTSNKSKHDGAATYWTQDDFTRVLSWVTDASPLLTTPVDSIGLAWFMLRQCAFWRRIVQHLVLVAFWIFLSHTLVGHNVCLVADSMSQNFCNYVQGSKDCIPFTHQETINITLLIKCKKSEASIDTLQIYASSAFRGQWHPKSTWKHWY